MPRFLTALPVYNEAAHVSGVLDEVLRFTPDVLVVDDGSTDGTSPLLAARVERQGDIRLVRHPRNQGYGAALATAFRETLAGPWDGLVTIDCDGQHQPQLIPDFIAALSAVSTGRPAADIVSGSRYLQRFPGDSPPPAAGSMPRSRPTSMPAWASNSPTRSAASRPTRSGPSSSCTSARPVMPCRWRCGCRRRLHP